PEEADGKMIYVGLLQGVQLAPTARQSKLLESIRAGDIVKAADGLRDEGIFVGERTLELDLVETFAAERQSAYADLTSAAAKQRFAKAIEGAVKREKAGTDEMMLRISRVGKGRFAQRLAEKIGAKEPPEYMKRAIEKIVLLVEEINA